MEYDVESDLKILEAMASNLKNYLHSSELYGMIAHNMPRMTVGGLLLRLYQLKGLREALTPEQQQRLQAAQQQFEELRNGWQVHYEGKITQEINARLRHLKNFVDESEGRVQKDPPEVTGRTILAHLQEEAARMDRWSAEMAGALRTLDHRLRAIMGAGVGEFHWAKELKPLYPPERFWWLYN